jgi:hypothetical protein
VKREKKTSETFFSIIAFVETKVRTENFVHAKASFIIIFSVEACFEVGASSYNFVSMFSM